MILNLDDQFNYGESQELDSSLIRDKRAVTNPNILTKLQRPKLQKDDKNSNFKDNLQTSPTRKSPSKKNSPLRSYLGSKQPIHHDKNLNFQARRKSSVLNSKEIKVLESKNNSPIIMDLSKKSQKDKYPNPVITQNQDPKFFIEESKKLLKKVKKRFDFFH